MLQETKMLPSKHARPKKSKKMTKMNILGFVKHKPLVKSHLKKLCGVKTSQEKMIAKISKTRPF